MVAENMVKLIKFNKSINFIFKKKKFVLVLYENYVILLCDLPYIYIW